MIDFVASALAQPARKHANNAEEIRIHIELRTQNTLGTNGAFPRARRCIVDRKECLQIKARNMLANVPTSGHMNQAHGLRIAQRNFQGSHVDFGIGRRPCEIDKGMHHEIIRIFKTTQMQTSQIRATPKSLDVLKRTRSASQNMASGSARHFRYNMIGQETHGRFQCTIAKDVLKHRQCRKRPDNHGNQKLERLIRKIVGHIEFNRIVRVF